MLARGSAADIATTENLDTGTRSPFNKLRTMLAFEGRSPEELHLEHAVNVDVQTGAANVSVPVPAPSGRAGMGPSLALVYSSTGVGSQFGVGWNLSGLPAIGIDTRFHLPRWDGTDTFQLAGEDLVPWLERVAGQWQPRTRETTRHRITLLRRRLGGSTLRVEQWIEKATGRIHFRARDAQNTLTIFGARPNNAARIADPDNDERTFLWLPELRVGPDGNALWIEYAAEDRVGVDRTLPQEQGRRAMAQRYLKRIRYGNLAPLALTDDTVDGHLPAGSRWAFQLVLDYGDHSDADRPSAVPDQPWPVRPDATSTFRPGFELRTYRLCRRFLSFHELPELGSAPVFVGQLVLEHDLAAAGSTLRSIRYLGRREGAVPPARELPSLRMTYAPAAIERGFLDAPVQSQVPGGLASGRYALIDLYGEGLPGILAETEGAWYWKPNLGGGEFGAQTALCERPAIRPGTFVFGDPDRDGDTDFSQMVGRLAGTFELEREDGRWQGFQPFSLLPHVEALGGRVQWVDLNGDGRLDVLVSAGDHFVWYASVGDGFAPPVEVPHPAGLPAAAEDLGLDLFFADMNGDGLADLVRVQNGRVEYWPNLGNGRFGESILFDGGPQMAPDGEFDSARVRFVDLDGSGTADLLYLGVGEVKVWHNASGNALVEAPGVRGLPYIDRLSSVRVLDFLGDGRPCLVWSSATPNSYSSIEYLPLAPAVRPRQLVALDDSLGRETRITYASSASHYLRDQARGHSWTTRLPAHVTVVDRLEETDHISSTRSVTRYEYHDGYYDGGEREFRGFGQVDAYDASAGTGTSEPGGFAAPLLTRTWFHLGAPGRKPLRPSDTYTLDLDLPTLPTEVVGDALEPGEFEDALRAVAGQVLRRETYSINEHGARGAHPYAIEQICRRIRKRQPRFGMARAAFAVLPEETLTTTYEQTAGDPRVQAQVAVAIDDRDQLVREATIAYPRRPGRPRDIAAQGETAIIVHDHRLMHVDVDERFELGVPVEARTYELAGLGGGWISPDRLRAADVAAALAVPRLHHQDLAGEGPIARLLSWDRSFYWNHARDGADAFGLIGARALVHHEESAVFSMTFVADAFGGRVDAARLGTLGYRLDGALWWQSDDVHVWGAAGFDLRVGLDHQDGTRTRFEYDAHGLEIIAIVDARGNRTSVEIDYVQLAPWRITDPNGSVSEVQYDALGVAIVQTRRGSIEGQPWGMAELAAHIARMPANVAALLRDPSQYLQGSAEFTFYDLGAWARDGSPTLVARLTQEELRADGAGSGVADGRIAITVEYLDGLGRTLQAKSLVDPGPAIQRDDAGHVVVDGGSRPILAPADERWRASGHVVYDAKQRPGRVYEPYFTPTWQFEGDQVLQQLGAVTMTMYDAVGRVVRKDYPNGTFEQASFSAWSRDQADPNDTVERSLYRFAREGRPADDPERQAYEHARAHRDTTTTLFLDARGLEVGTLVRGGGAGDRRTEIHLDAEGQPLEVVDPRGLVAFSYRRDMQGRVAFSHSRDAGDAWTLHDAEDRVAVLWDARGFEVTHTYDALDRATSIHVHGNGLDHRVEERVYGEDLADRNAARARNLLGRAAVIRDQAGVVTFDRTSPDGQVLRATRQLRRDEGEPDWAGPVALGESFATEAGFDALGRVVLAVFPDGSRQTTRYRRDGALARVGVTVPGGVLVDEAIVTDADHDARGQRRRLSLGNGVEVAYDYDPETFRLTQQRATRGGRTYQDVRYTWDPFGNLVRLHDRAQDPGRAAILANATTSARRDFVYDAHYRLVQASGRVHQALLERDYIPGSSGTIKGTRHLSLANSVAVESYTRFYAYDASNNLRAIRNAGESRSWTMSMWISPNSNRSLPALDPNGLAILDPEARFDAAGQLLRLDHLRSIEWSWRGTLNRAAVIERADGDADAESYTYDAESQRVRKVSRRVMHGGNVEVIEKVYLGACERKRIRLGETVIVERWTQHVSDGAGRIALVHHWTRDDAARETNDVARPRVYYQLTTHQGSSAIELDSAGEIVTYEEYFPYGGTAFVAGDAAVVGLKEYRYSGKERDDATSLYYYGFRYYAPWIGRWMSPDPIGPQDDLNLYQFVLGDPVSNVDADGLQTRGQLLIYEQEQLPEWARGYFHSLPAGVQRQIVAGNRYVWFDLGTRQFSVLKPSEYEAVVERVRARGQNVIETDFGRRRGQGGDGSRSGGSGDGGRSRRRGGGRDTRRGGSGIGRGGGSGRARGRHAPGGRSDHPGRGPGQGRTTRGTGRGAGTSLGSGTTPSSGDGVGGSGDASDGGGGGDGTGDGGTGSGSEGDGPGSGEEGEGPGGGGVGEGPGAGGTGAGADAGTGGGEGLGGGVGEGQGTGQGTRRSDTPSPGDGARGSRDGGNARSGNGRPDGRSGGSGANPPRSGNGRNSTGPTGTGPSGTGSNSGSTEDPNLTPSSQGLPAPPGLTENGTDPNGNPNGRRDAPPGGSTNGGPDGRNTGSRQGTQGGSPQGEAGGIAGGQQGYREDALDALTRWAGYANFEFSGGSQNGQRRGIPGGRGRYNLGWFGQVLYIALTVASWIGPGTVLKGLRLGGRLAIRGIALVGRGGLRLALRAPALAGGFLRAAHLAINGLRARIGRGILLDNNILSNIAARDAQALVFASRNAGRIYINTRVAAEFVQRFGAQRLTELSREYGIRQLASLETRAAGIITGLGGTSMRRLTDASVIATAERYGLRLATGDRWVVSAALRSGLTQPGQVVARLFERSQALRLRFYQEIRNLVPQWAGRASTLSPHAVTGSPIGR